MRRAFLIASVALLLALLSVGQTVVRRPIVVPPGGGGGAGTITFVAAGGLATNNTTTTLTITGPSCNAEDILIASVLLDAAQTLTPPANWTIFVQVDNPDGVRFAIAWKRAGGGDTAANFDFAKATDDNLLFAGIIAAYRGCLTSGTPIDATTPTTNASAGVQDNVDFSSFDPTGATGGTHLVFEGAYMNDGTTFGSVTGTDPTATNRFDVETSVGNDCSIYMASGDSSGAATGARSAPSNSGSDFRSVGVLFGLAPN